MNTQRKCLSALFCWRLELLGMIVAVLVVGSTGCSNSSTLTPVASEDAGATELDSEPRTDSGTEIDLSSEVDSSPELKLESGPALALPKYRYGIVEQLARPSSRQTVAEFEATLASLNKIHDHPLYSMAYEGDYEIQPEKLFRAGQAASTPDFGCSLFYQYQKDQPVFGRNFDWDSHPAMILFTRPLGRYASVSMVDTAYLGFSLDDLEAFDSKTQQRACVEATQIPLDGMNEHGLTIGVAVVPAKQIRDDPEVPNAHALHMVRLILDTAKNVAEAKSIFERYDVVFTGAPHVHFLLGDAKGQSMVVEIGNGDTTYLVNDATVAGAENWQSATNFHLREEENPVAQCPRFAQLKETLTATDPVDLKPMKLLSKVANSSTQWSAVYYPGQGKVDVVMGRDYENALKFELKDKANLIRPKLRD